MLVSSLVQFGRIAARMLRAHFRILPAQRLIASGLAALLELGAPSGNICKGLAGSPVVGQVSLSVRD